MAYTRGSKVLYSDVNTVKTAVHSAYNKTVGRAPTWSYSPTQGGLLLYATLNEINSHGSTANSRLRTTGCSTHYVGAGTGNTSNDGYTWTDFINFVNNKCGGELDGLDYFAIYKQRNSRKN